VPKQPINPPTLWPGLPHGFSQGVSCHGGRTVYLSGQTAWDANKTLVGGRDLKEQTCQALRVTSVRWWYNAGMEATMIELTEQ
jgi:enamine deaminase RidA (YjgF/YER057c/UK114 family)